MLIGGAGISQAMNDETATGALCLARSWRGPILVSLIACP